MDCKRMKLAIAIFAKADARSWGRQSIVPPREIQVAVVIWEGLTNCEIGRIIGTSGEVMKIQLCSTFDTLGIWSRLELAM
jgi:DNA-binding NarL/FixJ family response regulator